MRTYQHSGIVPVSSAVAALSAGCLAAPILGVLYSFTFYYIPFVYLNFVLACAFGGGVGWVVGYLARAGKIRNTNAVAGLAFVATLVGIYAEWGSTLYALTPASELPGLWAAAGLWTFYPTNIAMVMTNLFAEGSWGLSGNTTIHGWPLVVLWVVEAGLIFSMSIAAATQQIARRPFCETCQKWIDSQTPYLYAGDGSESVWNDVQQGQFESLALTARADGTEAAYMRLTLSVCESCSESNYLSVTACQNTTDSKGHPKLEERDLVTHLILQPTQVDIVQAANLIAPEVGGTPLVLPGATDSWTVSPAPTPLPQPADPLVRSAP
jgi:hypothetical protein